MLLVFVLDDMFYSHFFWSIVLVWVGLGLGGIRVGEGVSDVQKQRRERDGTPVASSSGLNLQEFFQ